MKTSIYSVFVLLTSGCGTPPPPPIHTYEQDLPKIMHPAPAASVDTRTCDVVVCNRIERFTLSPWSAIKDNIGETCFGAVLPVTEAVAGHVLSSESRWYQGRSINPTKASVTRVKSVGVCR